MNYYKIHKNSTIKNKKINQFFMIINVNFVTKKEIMLNYFKYRIVIISYVKNVLTKKKFQNVKFAKLI